MALDLPEYDPARIHHARVSYDDVAKVTADLLAMTGRPSGSSCRSCTPAGPT